MECYTGVCPYDGTPISYAVKEKANHKTYASVLCYKCKRMVNIEVASTNDKTVGNYCGPQAAVAPSPQAWQKCSECPTVGNFRLYGNTKCQVCIEGRTQFTLFVEHKCVRCCTVYTGKVVWNNDIQRYDDVLPHGIITCGSCFKEAKINVTLEYKLAVGKAVMNGNDRPEVKLLCCSVDGCNALFITDKVVPSLSETWTIAELDKIKAVVLCERHRQQPIDQRIGLDCKERDDSCKELKPMLSATIETQKPASNFGKRPTSTDELIALCVPIWAVPMRSLAEKLSMISHGDIHTKITRKLLESSSRINFIRDIEQCTDMSSNGYEDNYDSIIGDAFYYIAKRLESEFPNIDFIYEDDE